MAPEDTTDRELWNERYRTGDYHHGDDPAPMLVEAVDWLPRGRALDVATGAGRNALFLADHGYEVDAVDIAEAGLAIGRREATDRGVDVNWIQADLDSFPVPSDAYAVVCAVGYHDVALLDALSDALVRGGVLLYEHHLGPAAIADRGPRDDRFRARSNEVLHACLDLTVLEYREWSETDEGRGIDPRVRLVARNGLDGEAWYPPVRPGDDRFQASSR